MSRDNVSAYLGLGGLSVLVAGAALLASRSSNTTVAVGLTVFGAASLVVCGAMNARAVAAYGRSRSARYGTNALLMTVFFTAILVVIQAIAVRNAPEFDFTRNQRYTLAPQTTSVLAALSADVHVTAFFRLDSAGRMAAEPLLELYARHSHRLTWEVVDPDRRPDRADAMGATYGDMVVESLGRTRVVDQTTEEKLTNAIIQVTRGELKSVYFVTGHNEKNIQSGERTGYSAVHRALEGQGYAVHEMALLDVERVPDDCAVLVVAGPAMDYIATETQRIDAYLQSGGSGVFLLEPRDELRNLEALLRQYGIEVLDVEVLDEVTVQDGNRAFGPRWAKVLRYEPHEITRNFNAATFYPGARPVRIAADPDDLRIRGTYLAITPETAWGETDESSFETGSATRDGDDIAGPLPVAAVVERTFGGGGSERFEGKVVVVGDSDFIANANFGLLGNSDFFLNAVSYLAHEEDLIEIRPRSGLGDRVYITERQGRLIFVVCIVLLPLSVVVVGASVVIRRRRS